MSKRPTPETDAVRAYEGNWDTKALRMTAHARKLERERDEARAEVEHWRVKAEAYGGMVHGCGPVLESAGHPIDPFQPDGCVGGIARSVAALVKERDEARAAARTLAEHGEREMQKLIKERDEAREELASAQNALDAIHLGVGSWISKMKQSK